MGENVERQEDREVEWEIEDKEWCTANEASSWVGMVDWDFSEVVKQREEKVNEKRTCQNSEPDKFIQNRRHQGIRHIWSDW